MTMLYSEHRRVLLIDENSRKLNLLATILRNHEVEVHSAAHLEEARSLWKNIPYDLVLLGASGNSDQATLASVQIRKSKPRQRIALLVGPPVYIRELGRPSAKLRSASAPLADENSSTPQWPEIVQKLVSDWYVDQSARFSLQRGNNPPVSGLPFLSDEQLA